MNEGLKLYCLIALLLTFNSYSQNNKSKIEKDLDSLTKLIEQCPNCSSPYFKRGKINASMNKKMDAMKDFNKAIEIHIEKFEKNYRLTESYNERAYLKMDLKDYRGALQDFNNASNTNDGYSKLWVQVLFGRGYCKTKTGDLKGAVIDYEKVFLHDQNDKLTHFNLGLIKIDLGMLEEGCLNLSKAGELGFDDAYDAIAKYCN